jgi:RND superfamily putative drug exporter
VHRLRAEIRQAGLTMHVGSVTAVAIDAADHIGARLPYMVTAVIILSFLLLLAVFRSVLVAIKAGIMNLLSIGAAYGVIVAIFQWGWLSDIVGIGRPGPIEFWVPMMLFTVLFGLSMDYEVFLLSRVREEYLVSGDNATAVADGLAATARVITAAAAIMIAVFMSFVLGDLRVLKLMGLGLATAIFIDATIVRMVLVPATMELLGKANWWIPKWIDRILPRISIEAPPDLRLKSASVVTSDEDASLVGSSQDR